MTSYLQIGDLHIEWGYIILAAVILIAVYLLVDLYRTYIR